MTELAVNNNALRKYFQNELWARVTQWAWVYRQNRQLRGENTTNNVEGANSAIKQAMRLKLDRGRISSSFSVMREFLAKQELE